MFGDESEREREQLVEAAVAQAQREYKADNKDVQTLMRWGGALLELAHFKQGDEAVQCIYDAIEKLKEAIVLDDSRTEAHWYLGNAYTSLGFLQDTKAAALEKFELARDVFQACREKEPDNESYKKALEMCDKAPEYYDEIQIHLQQAQAAAGGPSGAKRGSGTGGSKDPLGISDFWWDAAGWVLLVAGIGAIALVARGSGGAPAAPTKA